MRSPVTRSSHSNLQQRPAGCNLVRYAEPRPQFSQEGESIGGRTRSRDRLPRTMFCVFACCSPSLEAADHILQEIAAVGCRLETMDSRIYELGVASSSIRADIAGFRETVNNLDQRLTIMEDQVAALPDQEAVAVLASKGHRLGGQES
ncbi:hypothetical protein NDU88_002840 [Pleurodeles waltl]|uniref:Uncharacterized protein n=1 Tax=Pleurodeles waltl TaxID=8319 RepID=A0AAV7WR24_PLEWA|nr:hypothetical protein NDU88_002840 [Pleurodeles waltl]